MTSEELIDPRQLFVISGPSGVGKNTIARDLCARGLATRAVTATTRPPRPGEQDGTDYHFVSVEQFQKWIRSDALLEHTQYVGNYYGTPVDSVKRAAASGLPVLLTIDVDGGLQIKRRWPQATLIFLEPPSEDELRRRLRGRGRDDEEEIDRRIERAREEMDYADKYDFRVVNNDLETAVVEIARIMAKRYETHGEE